MLCCFLCLPATGDVLACGSNGSGQCGQEPSPVVRPPRRIAAFSRERVLRVISGSAAEHVLLLTVMGKLYTFGANDYGQLGHPSTPSSHVPREVDALKGKFIVDGACGCYHSMVSTVDGELFAFGRNDSGQLGTAPCESIPSPTLVSQRFSSRVELVACGRHFSLVSLADDTLWAFESCGVDIVANISAQNVASAGLRCLELKGNRIKKIASGLHHALILGASGSVFGWGSNQFGQLGLPARCLSEPVLLERMSRMEIVDVACGAFHSLCVSHGGRLYVFGRNNHGQLGIDTRMDSFMPQLVTFFATRRVRKISGGFFHSVCLVENDHEDDPPDDLATDFRRLLSNGLFSDVTFIVDGAQLHAHKCVLSARSDFFQALFSSSMQEASQAQVEVPDHSSSSFEALLEYLYTSDVAALSKQTMQCDQMLDLLVLANQYHVTKLASRCERALKKVLSTENVASVTEVAHQLNLAWLERICLEFIIQLECSSAHDVIRRLPESIAMQLRVLARSPSSNIDFKNEI